VIYGPWNALNHPGGSSGDPAWPLQKSVPLIHLGTDEHMARTSIETAQQVIETLLNEQNRDRDNLQRMLVHSEKMSEHLIRMRDEEVQRVETEASDRKAAIHKMFASLLTVEDERRQRLNPQIADIAGLEAPETASVRRYAS
jgi:hypothetical protein